MDARKTVLIVDDNPDAINILSHQLRKDGYAVRSARDGAEALEVLSRPPLPDLLLLDLMMPRMGGFTVLEKMRSDPSLSKIPVVIVSAKAETQTKIKAISLGASEYLVKPLQPADVTQAVLGAANRGKFCTTAKELGDAMFGLSDDTAIKRIKHSHSRGYRPCPAWQDENGRWCGFFNEVRAWLLNERKNPRSETP